MRDKNYRILILLVLLSLSNCAMADNKNLNVNQNSTIERIKANKDTLVKAQDAMSEKDYQTAITLLTGYINEKPKKYEAYKLRGDAYYALRRYYMAQKDYQTAIDIKSSEDKLMTNTKYVSAIVLGADKHEQLQNPELGDLYRALMYAQKAMNDPAYTTSYTNAVKYNSHIYLPQPNKNEVNRINCPQKYGKMLNPQGIDANINGAITDIEKGNFNESLYKLQDVTLQYPNYYLGHYLTGVALSGLEKEDEAIKSFEKAISLNPYDFESRASLGRIYYSKAETTFSEQSARKSIEYFNQALKQNKNCPTYYFYIGMDELQIGNNNVAISNFDKALQINPSDYNSMYYKLIAQYINGSYKDVVEGTSKLLLKHVSNYNSVLYLRALAYTQLNDYDNALQDLNNIENNIGDIYNTDIKTVSDRERCLESYVHYLKAQIQHIKGAGAAEDNSIAYSNPIIDRLSNAQKTMEPYEKSLQGESISLKDYNKFESFYSTSLPKLLESGIVITYDDVDNQYDYIRTTFADLGISFLYLNPNYKMTTIKDYPYKKYSNKLGLEEQKSLSQRPASDMSNVALAKTQEAILKKSTPSSELILSGGQPSLSQMLASNALSAKSKPVEIKEPIIIRDAQETVSSPNFKPEIPDADKIDTSKNIASGESFVSKNPAMNSDNSKKVTQIVEEEKTIQDETQKLNQTEESKDIKKTETENIKISAQNQVKTPDVIIRNKPEVIPEAESVENKTPEDKNTVNSAAEVSENVQMPMPAKAEEKPLAQEPKASSGKIVEKHAAASEINARKQSKSLTIDDLNDIVELDTSTLNKKINNESDLFNSNTVFAKPQNEGHDLTPPVKFAEESPAPKNVSAADKDLTKEKLSQAADKALPSQTTDNASVSEITSSGTNIIENEAEAIKAKELKMKEEAKYDRQEQKALARELKEQAKAQKNKEKEEIAQMKRELKQQKILEKEQLKIEKQQAKIATTEELEQMLISEQPGETAKFEKEIAKEQKALIAEQEKIVEQNDETKIQHLKTRLIAMRGSVTSEEEKAQKLQLKAERAKAKEEYKAKKLALKEQKAYEKAQNKQIKQEQKIMQNVEKMLEKDQKLHDEIQNVTANTQEKFSFKKMFSKMKFWNKK